MPYVPNTTWVDGAAGGTPLSAARLNNLEAGVTWTYETYTPTWASSGTAPSIGNGTLLGRFAQRGKFVTGYGYLLIGSSTSVGTGSYTFALPVAASTNLDIMGIAKIIDSSAGFMALAAIRLVSSSVMDLLYETAHNAGYSGVGAAAPYALATSDRIGWQFSYEAA